MGAGGGLDAEATFFFGSTMERIWRLPEGVTSARQRWCVGGASSVFAGDDSRRKDMGAMRGCDRDLADSA